jgi:hypothetical protein
MHYDTQVLAIAILQAVKRHEEQQLHESQCSLYNAQTYTTDDGHRVSQFQDSFIKALTFIAENHLAGPNTYLHTQTSDTPPSDAQPAKIHYAWPPLLKQLEKNPREDIMIKLWPAGEKLLDELKQ